MNTIRFSCTALAGTNKAGELKADENGCFETVVGGLNVFNSAGQYYVYEQAKDLFESSSQFMRRVQKGVLKGECGHPKMQPGMTGDQFANRCMSIYEDNVCCIHKEIWLDFDKVKDDQGRPVIAIMSRVQPSGPMGPALEKSFKNPGENVYFSIRAFTDDYRDAGVTKRVLKTIVTFDNVTEGGIAYASKFKSPSLESLEERMFSRGELERSIKPMMDAGIALESTFTAQELFKAMKWNVTEEAKAKLPHYMKW